MRLVTKPEWHRFDRSIVSVELAPDDPSGWVVTLSIAHQASASPIHADALTVVLRDASHRVVVLRGRPTDPLIEVGGSQAKTTQAKFRFEPSPDVPQTVEVTFSGATRVFDVVAPPSAAP